MTLKMPQQDSFFSSTIRLLDQYYWRHARQKTPGFGMHQLLELRERLKQLSYLHLNIIAGQEQLLQDHEAKNGPRKPNQNLVLVFASIGLPSDAADVSGSERFTTQDELKLHLETFYYIAHRIKVILQKAGGALPQLDSFEAIGITRVRNNLLEHANQKGGRIVYSFSVSNAAGARLRPVGMLGDADTFVDPGFPSNASEFKQNLERLLTA